MEDAMILNKAAVERGFAHASVYKCEVKLMQKLHWWYPDVHLME